MFLLGSNISSTAFSDSVEEHEWSSSDEQRSIAFGLSCRELFGKVSESVGERRRSVGGEELPRALADAGDRLCLQQPPPDSSHC